MERSLHHKLNPGRERSKGILPRASSIATILSLTVGLFSAWAYDFTPINLWAVKQIESSGNPKAHNKGSDCRGLYQINPKGALADWNAAHPSERYTPDDLFISTVNEKIASWYLYKKLPAYLTHYKIPVTVQTVLASYNWGIGNVKRWYRAGAVYSELPRETQNYLKKYGDLTNG